MMSEKIRPDHLERKAILYVRQSSTHQVLHNRESSALQYAMRDRLTALGWSRIETVDDDLGRSAAGGVVRAGFDRMVSEVCLGKVGAVAAREVSRFARNSREPRCIAFGGLRVDDAIEVALLQVVEPGAISAAVEAEAQAVNRHDQARDALTRDLEAARYGADRAFRQYDAADPQNRLVTSELELRWNQALARVDEIESRIAAHDAVTPKPSPLSPTHITALATDLQAVWAAPTTDARLKKRIVRTVIHEVVADVDDAASEIVLLIHWTGGVHTELRLPKRRRGQRNSTSADIIAAVRQLVLVANDDLIAGILNRNGLVTGHGNRWTRERVTALRSYHKIPAFRPAADGNEPWLNLSKAARLLGIAAKTLRLAAKAGEIESVHPLPDGPWIFSRSALGEPAAQRIVHRARQNLKYPAGSHHDQQNLFSSTA